MIAEDRREFTAILFYSLIQSLLLLAIPLAAQALVNVVVGGLYLQPLVVLTGALFFGLLGAGLISIIRFFLVEVMRERIFARVALRVTDLLPRVSYRFIADRNGPELMNRFFDVVNVQKSWTKIAFDGPGAILDIVVGIILLGIYGTELLGLSSVIMLGGLLVICAAGFRGLQTSLDESTQKYRVADWLEEMVHCQDALKFNSNPEYWLNEMDKRVVSYLRDRRRHFWIIVRQKGFYHVISAFALAGMLGAGGYLVLEGELTLGQLVAAELVIWSILKAAQKVVGLAESFFDLLTALEKVSYITTKMEIDKAGTALVDDPERGVQVGLRGVTFAYTTGAPPVFSGLNLTVKPDEIVTILGEPGSGKSTLIGLIAGYLKPDRGAVDIDNISLRDLHPDSLARNVSLLTRHTDLFTGTLLDNIALGRELNLRDCKHVLETFLTQDSLSNLGDGMSSQVICGGQKLSGSDKAGILLTRSLVCEPRLLLLDESLSHLSEKQQRTLAAQLKEPGRRCTVISTLPLPDLVVNSDRIILLQNGEAVQTLTPQEIVEQAPQFVLDSYPNMFAAVVAKIKKSEGRS
jgi:ATP-binding cassette subfamily B protein